MNDRRKDGRPIPDAPTSEPTVPRDHYPYVRGGAPPEPTTPEADDPTPEDDAQSALVDRLDPGLETPRLRPAVLGRLEGLGLLIVVRDAEGEPVSRDGIWQPADETVSLEELQRTFPVGSGATFTGTSVEARDASSAEEVSLEVVIMRHDEYEQMDGRPLRIVKFAPRGQP